MKRLLTLLSVVLIAIGVTAADRTKSAKRGFSEDNLAYVEDLQVLATGCTWYYNWGVQPAATVASYVGADKTIEFCPMAWNGSYDLTKLRAYYTAHPNDKVLLGFNEPNFSAQANMTPTQAAEKWPELEAFAEELGLTLVAPALNYTAEYLTDGKMYQPKEWMDAFIAKYKELYGKEPRMDYLALHCYMDYATAMSSFVEEFAERYGKKVWLTEFCAWEDANITAATQMKHMIDKLTLLEKSDNVYRYSWFKARSANKYPYYNLVEFPNSSTGVAAGTLTRLGFAYLHMSTFDSTRYYAPGEKIPMAEFMDEKNLAVIQKSTDPRCTDEVELSLNAAQISTSYQIDVPKAGTYTFIIRASRGDVTSDALTPRLAIYDADNNALASKIRIEATGGENIYKATQVQVTLPAGKQTISLYKENFSTVNVSMMKFVETVDANDEDLAASETEGGDDKGDTGGDDKGDTGGDTGDKGTDTSTNDNIKVTDAATTPYTFKAGEKYYALYLDATTRKANNISGDLYVNCGDNGGTQNSYLWDNTLTWGDATGGNSFGVTGEYKSVVVAEKGWSGLGYNVTGGLDLSGINEDYSLHMAVKSSSTATFNLYFTDGQGHVAKIILGSSLLDDSQNSETHKYLPVANFARDGKWHNIDIPMSYLKWKFGLCFGKDTDYSGNLFCINAGSSAGDELAYDAVFFHGPADSKPDTSDNEFDAKVTSAEENQFTFRKSNNYYIVYLDEETKSANLSSNQITDCGPNGSSRNLYIWENTFTMPSVTDANSFGVSGSYMRTVVGSVGWSGLGYHVSGSSTPLDLTGIDDTYMIHFAVKSTYTGSIEFEVLDGLGNNGWIVLGTENFEGHAPITDFPRDGKWYNIDIPVRNIGNSTGLHFASTTNMTGNLFCVLAGGTAGTIVDYDAVMIYGKASDTSGGDSGKLDDRKVSITKASENPFTFDSEADYYVIYLDDETKGNNISNDHYTNIGPNGTTQNVYPWENTVTAQTASGTNSFGVTGSYMTWEVGSVGWSGLGYNISSSGSVDLSGITSEYTLHFAVKSTSDAQYVYTVTDANGKKGLIILGTEKEDGVEPAGNFTRDGEWYNVDVPVSYLMKQGLDFKTATSYSDANILTIDGGSVQGTMIDYDAVFFYGPAKTKTGIDSTVADTTQATGVSVYTIGGVLVGKAESVGNINLQRGLYIVRTAQGVKKVLVK